jgi:hypothetical protein
MAALQKQLAKVNTAIYQHLKTAYELAQRVTNEAKVEKGRFNRIWVSMGLTRLDKYPSDIVLPLGLAGNLEGPLRQFPVPAAPYEIESIPLTPEEMIEGNEGYLNDLAEGTKALQDLNQLHDQTTYTRHVNNEWGRRFLR